MTREYVDDHRTRITSYRFIKTTTYPDEIVAQHRAWQLDLLRKAEFDWLCIPDFEYRVDGDTLEIESDFIKGWYCGDPFSLYRDVVNRNHPFTFQDPNPSNFITCKKTQRTFAIDLDSYTLYMDRHRLHREFIRMWQNSMDARAQTPKFLKTIEDAYERSGVVELAPPEESLTFKGWAPVDHS